MDVPHLFRNLPRVRRVSEVKAPLGFGEFMDFNFGFTYVFDGEARFRVEDQWFTARRGHCILRPPYVVHEIQRIGDSDFVQWLVTFETASDYDWAWPYPWVVELAEELRPRMEMLFLDLHEFHREYLTPSHVRSLARMLEIIDVYLQGAGERDAISAEDLQGWSHVQRAVEFITAYYRRPLTLLEIAGETGVSQTTLSRTFQRLMGVTVCRYLNLVRIRHARILLRESDMNCSEVAEEVGFSNVSVFSKAFRRFEGQSPTQWLQTGTRIYGGTVPPLSCLALKQIADSR